MTATVQATSGSSEQAAQRPDRFKIRYERLAIALLGVLAVVAAVVTMVLRAFGLVSLWVPVISAVVFLLSVVALRFLALQDRKKRLERVFQQAMGNQPIVASKPLPEASEPEAPAKETKLFDAQPAADAQQNVEPKKLSAAQLRQAAIAVSQGADVKDDGSWEPVAVPKPVYVEAAKAERPAPAPLDLPEAPKASAKTSIKQSEAGIAGAAAKPEQAAGLSNLDGVLQRRRA